MLARLIEKPYGVNLEIVSSCMMYVPSFMKTDAGVEAILSFLAQKFEMIRV
jgi:hypothetical protein